MSENYKAMFEMKQDDWIAECKESERLRFNNELQSKVAGGYKVKIKQLKQQDKVSKEINRNLANVNADYKQENEKLKECLLLAKSRIGTSFNPFHIICDIDDALAKISSSTGNSLGGNNE